MVTERGGPTIRLVVAVKLAETAPSATVTLTGTAAAAALELERDTAAPPDGAAPVSITVPVEAAPPTRLAGVRLRLSRLAGLTVSVAVLASPP